MNLVVHIHTWRMRHISFVVFVRSFCVPRAPDCDVYVIVVGLCSRERIAESKCLCLDTRSQLSVHIVASKESCLSHQFSACIPTAT